MFPNDIDKIRYPLTTRRWGVVIGTLIMIAVPLCLVSPGTLELTLSIALVAVLYAAWARGTSSALVPPLTHGTKIASALIGYAAISALWSVQPWEALSWVAGSGIAALGCGLAARSMLLEPRRNILHIAEGLWIGFLAGILYLGLEVWTDQSIKLFLYNLAGFKPGQLKPPMHFTWKDGHLISIASVDLTRSLASAPLLLWGALLAILGSQRAPLGRPLAIGTFVLTAAVVFTASNETAKVALACAIVSFAVASWSIRWSSRLLQTAWVVACLAIVPITLGLYRANLHNAAWLQPTAKHRIIIWNRYTEETMKRPLLGVGAGMAYWNYEISKKPMKGESYARYSRDVHCVFLQVWFELGVVGAMLLSLFGLALLQRLQRLPARMVPYAHAAFASAATTLGSSYGLWRPWFNLMFALAIVAFAIGVRAMLRKEHVLPVDGTSGKPHQNSDGV